MAPWLTGMPHRFLMLPISSHQASCCRDLIVLSLGRCLRGTSPDPTPLIIQGHDSIGRPRVRPEGKAGVLLQERIPSAPRDQAFPLALRALREGAEPAAIGVHLSLQDEDLDLMVSHPDLLFLEQLVEGQAAGPIEGLEPVQAIEPHRQIDVLAFVPDRDTPMSERLKPRYLPPQRPGH